MTPNLLDELARIALVAQRDTPSFRDRSDCLHFLRTHAPTLADMAKRMEAAERECEEQARLNGMGAERELALRARLEAAERDSKRLDALEAMANKPGGILLHDGSESGRCGIGLRPGFASRTLRQAIDATQEGEG